MSPLHPDHFFFLSEPLKQYQLTAPCPVGHQNCDILSKDRAVSKSCNPVLPLHSSDTWEMQEERSKVEDVLKTEQAGGIQSPLFFQIKETYSLLGLLGPDRAISQTQAFISLQMGPTSPLWRWTEYS